MVKIRLARLGSKKKPFYRVVVSDARKPRDSGFIEMVGFYDPNPDPPKFDLRMERIKMWLDRGAQPTKIVERLIAKSGEEEIKIEETVA